MVQSLSALKVRCPSLKSCWNGTGIGYSLFAALFFIVGPNGVLASVAVTASALAVWYIFTVTYVPLSWSSTMAYDLVLVVMAPKSVSTSVFAVSASSSNVNDLVYAPVTEESMEADGVIIVTTIFAYMWYHI